MSKPRQSLIPTERIEHSILLIRGQRVMLDRDLATLYGVPTRVLNQAVRRNIARFPEDFMFQLTNEEFENWRSQFVTSNPATKMATRYHPTAFTEHGIAMLSSVLNSERAVAVNIEIMRTFVRLRQWLTSNKDLAKRLDDLEMKYDRQFKSVFDAIRQLMSPPAATPKKGELVFVAHMRNRKRKLIPRNPTNADSQPSGERLLDGFVFPEITDSKLSATLLRDSGADRTR